MRGIGWTHRYLLVPDLEKWWYVGNTPPIPRLGIPSLNMQDSAGGFRTYWSELVGTVTCWPSLLSMAATFDTAVMDSFATALGQEFAAKGANTILGPSINVHRVARNRRNFEYLSGEDPFLGAQLTTAYVKGVQSQGVLAVAKHFVLNNQETNRMSESSYADDRTLWELYHPPFQAAVDAGVSAFMWGYNGVNGSASCSNSPSLKKNLKQKMGFRGFVQSDWWATHNASVEQGLDQEMPGEGMTWFSSTYFTDKALAAINPKAIDDSVRRILTAMYRMDLFSTTKCSAPCQRLFTQKVKSKDHARLAHEAARDSIVLLKNDGDFLPLTPTRIKSIAVIGSVAVAAPFDPSSGQGASISWNKGDYYSGGGSGHITAGNVTTPLDGIKDRATKLGISVIESTTDDIAAAVTAAALSDMAIVVAGATSGEAEDRSTLAFDNKADALISAVAAQAKKTLVLGQVPGVVTMPWRDDVEGIAVMFLGGEKTGSAWASMIFGDHAPAGRLPVMIPLTEADTIAPSDEKEIIYAEGLATSYRNPKFKAAFPFGHGLTYTTFKLGVPKVHDLCNDFAYCITMNVTNTGKSVARHVVQLYYEFPPEAAQPVPILKGFLKTGNILPGQTETITFRLSQKDVSYWHKGSWIRSKNGTAHIGASSADIHHLVALGPALEIFV